MYAYAYIDMCSDLYTLGQVSTGKPLLHIFSVTTVVACWLNGRVVTFPVF